MVSALHPFQMIVHNLVRTRGCGIGKLLQNLHDQSRSNRGHVKSILGDSPTGGMTASWKGGVLGTNRNWGEKLTRSSYFNPSCIEKVGLPIYLLHHFITSLSSLYRALGKGFQRFRAPAIVVVTFSFPAIYCQEMPMKCFKELSPLTSLASMQAFSNPVT